MFQWYFVHYKITWTGLRLNQGLYGEKAVASYELLHGLSSSDLVGKVTWTKHKKTSKLRYGSECIRKAAYKQHIFHNTEFHRILQLIMQIMLLTLHKFI
jgi:hypothetical protein